MNTPITDAASVYTDAFDSPNKARDFAGRLELDRAALMEALQSMLDLTYAVGINYADTAIEEAETAIENARANFPTV
jgi:hypothetical protein